MNNQTTDVLPGFKGPFIAEPSYDDFWMVYDSVHKIVMDCETQQCCTRLALILNSWGPVVEALKRMRSECSRYLEEQMPSESESCDPNYVGPLTQTEAALNLAGETKP